MSIASSLNEKFKVTPRKSSKKFEYIQHVDTKSAEAGVSKLMKDINDAVTKEDGDIKDSAEQVATALIPIIRTSLDQLLDVSDHKEFEKALLASLAHYLR